MIEFIVVKKPAEHLKKHVKRLPKTSSSYVNDWQRLNTQYRHSTVTYTDIQTQTLTAVL